MQVWSCGQSLTANGPYLVASTDHGALLCEASIHVTITRDECTRMPDSDKIRAVVATITR